MKNTRKKISIYFTANYPEPNQNLKLLKMLEQAGVDFVELGIPSSDPLADGPVIQHSSTQALSNGFSMRELFSELQSLKHHVSIPVYIMAYYNQILQFGITEFVQTIKQIGIKGIIVPDAPLVGELSKQCKKAGLHNVKMISPTTSIDRVLELDRVSSGFLYAVSSSSTTGQAVVEPAAYLQKVNSLGLKNPIVTGFGIRNQESFIEATRFSSGAIVGSAFIQFITKKENFNQSKINAFVQQFKSYDHSVN